jgi:predicted O-methyltransferase YrrM
MADIVSGEVAAYLESLVPPRPAELEAMEAYAREHSFPIIGPVCAHLCYQIARMIGARRVFELGSGYGYSTAFFAKAVRENGGGEVHHVVWDEELSARARRHLAALGFEDVVTYHVAEAVSELRGMNDPFDLIFNDIDKHGYPDSLPVVEEKLRPGGVLIIDNMLWSGRIFEPADQSPDTVGVRRFTERILASDRWIVSLVPIRDGMIVATKR